MTIAVLPFNAAEGTKPAYGRQFAAFAGEQLRNHANAEINAVSLLTQVPDEQGGPERVAFVNVSDELLPYEQLSGLFEQGDVELIQDGRLEATESGFRMTVRYHKKGQTTPVSEEVREFDKAQIFQELTWLTKRLAAVGEIALPEELSGELIEFGTDDADAFLDFLEGFDAVSYIGQANGLVAREFSPDHSIDALLSAVEKDADFEGPYHVLVQLVRACAQYGIGDPAKLESSLTALTTKLPDEMGAYFGLGELYTAMGDPGKASDFFEKAVQREPNDPALYVRLGLAQMQANMPVNAERNFRKAYDLEGPDKPSTDYLANVLQTTNREHEVPALWKGLIDLDPQNAQAHVKYAMALHSAGKAEEAKRAFDVGLETLEDNTLVKRYYAPLLAAEGEHDRAMDFYEDALEVAPNDIPTLSEYGQVLEAAGRQVDVPEVLDTILASNPDPDTRAVVLARKTELEEPKRVEAVEAARQKMEGGDVESGLRELRPLRNWLADYWKLWALLASGYNRTEQYKDAEDAAMRLIELYPGCEPAYGELMGAMVGQDRAEEAWQMMQWAVSRNPQSLSLHLNLGLAAAKAGHKEEAKQIARQLREAVGPNEELEPVFAEMEA